MDLDLQRVKNKLKELPQQIINSFKDVLKYQIELDLLLFSIEKEKAKIYLRYKEENPKATVKEIECVILENEDISKLEIQAIDIKSKLACAKSTKEGLEVEFTAIRKEASLIEAEAKLTT